MALTISFAGAVFTSAAIIVTGTVVFVTFAAPVSAFISVVGVSIVAAAMKITRFTGGAAFVWSKLPQTSFLAG
jgi:hypothetical protein